jgi:tRNA dimethylallyltransferase
MPRTKEKLKVVVILGPTSSGKTELAIQLAKKFNGVIISADSRQIYKKLDIATAKPNSEQLAEVRHYMIDIIEPDDHFSLKLYQQTAYNLLNNIAQQNRKRTKKILPFLVGGTGLYIQSIVEGYKIPGVEPDLALREKLDNLTIKELKEKLLKLSPNSQVDLGNKRRLIRAIEIFLQRGENIKEKVQPNDFEFLQIGIDIPREELNKKIEAKVEEMYKAGLIKETKHLIEQGYDFKLPALSSLGYNYIKDYINHKTSLRKALELMKNKTKQYAKRQMTWFKRDKRTHWIKGQEQAEKLIKEFIN